MKQVVKIDINGYYLEPVIIEYEEDMQHNYIKTIPPNGLYRAKWTGLEWIEDMSPEEIDELNNQPRVLTEIEQLKISQAEQFEAILELLGGMM